MLSPKKLLAIVVVGAISLLLAVQFVRIIEPAAAREVKAACNGLRSTPDSKTIKSIPIAAPDFSAFDHKGNAVKLSDFRGKVVMVNFWASWCSTCEAEKPSLERLQRDMGYDDFLVLALASDQAWQPIAKKFPNGSPLKILLDKPDKADEGGQGPIAKAWGIEAFPESFIIDKRGTIRYYFINKRDWDSSIAKTCLRALMDE